jgi:hypothetical protein
MIQRQPAFRFLWAPPDRIAMLKAVRADAPDVATKLQRWLEQGFSAAHQKQIREAIEQTTRAMLASTATALGASVALTSDELNVLMAVARRDFGQRWLQPDWRAQFSYRQLVQSRLWALRLRSATARPYVANLCAVETLFEAAADAAIAKQYGPWLDTVIRELTKIAAPLRPRGRAHAVAAAAAWDKLDEAVLTPATEEPYRELIWKHVS